MKLNITQIDYSGNPSGGAVLHVFGRDEDAQAHRIDLTGFMPYYFIPLEQADNMLHPSVMEIDKSKIYKSIYGDELRRVDCRNSPIDISFKLRYTTYVLYKYT